MWTVKINLPTKFLLLPLLQIDGLSIKLNRNSALFVTLTYDTLDDHSPLLDSLNLLFRPICCPEPDTEQIVEVSLIASGFVNAKQIARKITVLYTLAHEQLSQQSQYNFDLSSVVKVLEVSARMRFEGSSKTLTEYSIVVRVLTMVILPSLLPADIQLFKSLLKDLFPGVDCPIAPHAQLREAVAQLASEQSVDYVYVAAQEAKIIELHELISVHRATILLGESGSGKSSILDLLIKARNEVAKAKQPLGDIIATRRIVLNPKECHPHELLGYVDTVTKSWHDGLFSSIFREISEDSPDTEIIIHFDGEMDAGWVESLNTLLDNNGVLLLENGERLYFPHKHCSLLFEVTDLEHVSPATVARCGLVYCPSDALSYHSYWTRWIRQTCGGGGGGARKELRGKLQKLFRNLFVPCLEFVMHGGTINFQRIELEKAITQNEMGYVRQLCEILALLLDLAPNSANKFMESSLVQEQAMDKETKQNEGAECCLDESSVECLFIQAIYASCGALITTPIHQGYFDEYLKGRLEERPQVRDTEDTPALANEIPTAFPTFFDYSFDVQRKRWMAWRWLLPMDRMCGTMNDMGRKLSVGSHIPTQKTIRLEFYLNLCSKLNPVLLLGDVASGKSSLINHYLNRLDDKSNVSV